MDLKELKQKALKLKNDAVNYSARQLTNSGLTLDKKEEVGKMIKKSITTTFKNKETWKSKEYKHKAIIIFAEEWSDFFKKALYMLPVITAKAFSQNIPVRLAKSKIEWINLSDYGIENTSTPTLVVFQEEKVLKLINWEENILKLVKSFSLDINKQIEDA